MLHAFVSFLMVQLIFLLVPLSCHLLLLKKHISTHKLLTSDKFSQWPYTSLTKSLNYCHIDMVAIKLLERSMQARMRTVSKPWPLDLWNTWSLSNPILLRFCRTLTRNRPCGSDCWSVKQTPDKFSANHRMGFHAKWDESGAIYLWDSTPKIWGNLQILLGKKIHPLQFER